MSDFTPKRKCEIIESMYGELVGRTIKSVRPLTRTELRAVGWEEYGIPFMLILDDDTTLVPSKDDEGNGAGTLFINEFAEEDNE